jgi:hypothetical protein
MLKKQKLLLCMLIAAASVLAAACKKDNENNETAAAPAGQETPSDSGEGIYLGVIGFNNTLYVKDISRLTNSNVSEFNSFIYNLSSQNLTARYYADYSALKMMREYNKPPKLTNVALVTFTDGLDNQSLASDELNPENYTRQRL